MTLFPKLGSTRDDMIQVMQQRDRLRSFLGQFLLDFNFTPPEAANLVNRIQDANVLTASGHDELVGCYTQIRDGVSQYIEWYCTGDEVKHYPPAEGGGSDEGTAEVPTDERSVD